MRAGLLKHTITLQRGTQTVSESGSVSNRWTDYATIRAELVTHAIADTGMAYGEAAKSALVFRIRHFHGLTADERLIYRGQTYEITALAELGNRIMELACEVLK